MIKINNSSYTKKSSNEQIHSLNDHKDIVQMSKNSSNDQKIIQMSKK